MRTLMIVTCLFIFGLCAAADGQPDDDDVYSLDLVKFELAMRSGGQEIVHSRSLKRLQALGDRASIALIKILTDENLEDPQTVRSALSIVRDSFRQPERISSPLDREPKVTLVWLRYLRQRMESHIELQREVEDAIQFVTGTLPSS